MDYSSLGTVTGACHAPVAGRQGKVETLKRDVSVWKRKYEKLQEQTKDFMAALKRAPRKVKEFIQFVLHTEPEKPEQSGNRDMPRRKKRDMEL